MPLPSGTRLGPYEILGLAGAGGMGEVYKARDTRLHRIVALKLASDRLADDPDFRARFQREARATAALNHPHICAIHDVASIDGHDFIVMEYLDGETLEARLRRSPPPLPELFRIAIAIAEAMVAAHRAGIIHRDLKPSNVMLTPDGPKLLDFGIAKQKDHRRDNSSPTSIDATATAASTVEGTLVGTVPYMAPEQLEGRPVDGRTDIFAFGCLLFEIATGKRAFRGTSTAALVAAILAEQRPRRPETSLACQRHWIASFPLVWLGILTSAGNMPLTCCASYGGRGRTWTNPRPPAQHRTASPSGAFTRSGRPHYWWSSQGSRQSSWRSWRAPGSEPSAGDRAHGLAVARPRL